MQTHAYAHMNVTNIGSNDGCLFKFCGSTSRPWMHESNLEYHLKQYKAYHWLSLQLPGS